MGGLLRREEIGRSSAAAEPAAAAAGKMARRRRAVGEGGGAVGLGGGAEGRGGEGGVERGRLGPRDRREGNQAGGAARTRARVHTHEGRRARVRERRTSPAVRGSGATEGVTAGSESGPGRDSRSFSGFSGRKRALAQLLGPGANSARAGPPCGRRGASRPQARAPVGRRLTESAGRVMGRVMGPGRLTASMCLRVCVCVCVCARARASVSVFAL